MTDKLYCPFCGTELENACAQVIYFCPNDECHQAKDWYASKQVWQALIDGKKAQDALKVAVGALKQIQWFCYAPTLGERAYRMQQCANKTLTEIASITKQENA